MIIKQYKVVSGIATPVNENPWHKNYQVEPGVGIWKENALWKAFEDELAAHTYATNAQDGVYDADCFGEVVWQIKGKLNVDWVTIDEKHESYKLLSIISDRCKRQFLQLKDQPMSELPIPKMETTELPSPDSTSTPQGTFIINDDVTIEVLKTGIWFNDFLLDKNEAIKLSKLIQTAFLNNHER